MHKQILMTIGSLVFLSQNAFALVTDSVRCHIQTAKISAIQFSGGLNQWNNEGGLPVYRVDTLFTNKQGLNSLGNGLNMTIQTLGPNEELRVYWYVYSDVYKEQYVVYLKNGRGTVVHFDKHQAFNGTCEVAELLINKNNLPK